MAKVVRKWTGIVFLAVAALALASLAFDLVLVDADRDPPRAVSASGGVSVCERVAGGLLFAVDGGGDAVFAVSGGGNAALGYQVLSDDGVVLSEGECVYFPTQRIDASGQSREKGEFIAEEWWMNGKKVDLESGKIGN